MKRLIKTALHKLGYSLQKITSEPACGSQERGIGNMIKFMEDIRARNLMVDCILDVGANNACWAADALNIFPEAAIYLVEPQIEMEPILRQFCLMHKKAKYFLTSAGASSGEKFLTVWDDLSGSSLLPQLDGELIARGHQRLVPVVKIDDLLSSNNLSIPQLVKLDIQGYELEALKGASSLFGITEVFIVEASLFSFDGMINQPDFFEVVSFMNEKDYVVYDFAGFLRRPLDGALGQTDVCFVRKNGLFRASSKW
jgi:FkbM family methyltransferase